MKNEKSKMPNQVGDAKPVKGYEIHPDVLKENIKKTEGEEKPKNLSAEQLSLLKRNFPILSDGEWGGTRDEIISLIAQRTGQNASQVEVTLTGLK